MNKRKLTARQERFVDEYLVDLNATRAAIRAGYSARTAHSCGPRLLANAGVATAISAAKQARAEATQIDSAWVLRQAVALHQRCVQEIKPALHPKTRCQLKDEDGRPLFTFNAAVAARALELVGKHTAVAAFEDRIHHDLDDGVVEILQAARRRAGRPTIDAEFAEVPQDDQLTRRIEAGRKRAGRDTG